MAASDSGAGSAAPSTATDAHAKYQSPLTSRYASAEMSYCFSDKRKFATWRRLWINLAKAEKQLGLDISEEAIKQMEENESSGCRLSTRDQRHISRSASLPIPFIVAGA